MKLDYYINDPLRADFTCENWHSTACSEKVEAYVLSLRTDMLEFFF